VYVGYHPFSGAPTAPCPKELCIGTAAFAALSGDRRPGAPWPAAWPAYSGAPAALGEQAAKAPSIAISATVSGLLAAIGVAYWTTLPEIRDARARKFALLTVIRGVAGGFARALGMLIAGPPGAAS